MHTSLPLSPAVDGELRSFQNSHGYKVAYYQSHAASGKSPDAHPVVLLHSINAAASAYEVRPLFAHYASLRPTYALEWPGFGQSQRGPLQYGAQLYMETLREFLQLIRHQHPAADVVALSLSAEHAAAVAQQQAELFHTLTLISPTGVGRHQPRADKASLWLERLLANQPWSHALFDLLVSRVSLRYFLNKSFIGPPDPGFLAYAYETAHQPGAEYAPWAFLGGRFAVPDVLRQVYSALTVKTLVLYDQDAYTSFEGLDELVGQNPAVRARRIPNTRGLPQWDSPQLTLAVLNEHLLPDRQPTAPARLRIAQAPAHK